MAGILVAVGGLGFARLGAKSVNTNASRALS